jgi:hypothetical protein
MKKSTVGIIAGVVVAVVLAATGIALASAETTNDTTNTATQLGRARDTLAAATEAHDLAGVRKAVDDLVPVLAKVRTDVDRGALRAETAGYLGTTERQTAELREQLAGPEPRGGILDSVTGLLGSLLDSIKDLLNSLLGGGGGSTETTKPTTTTQTPPTTASGTPPTGMTG